MITVLSKERKNQLSNNNYNNIVNVHEKKNSFEAFSKHFQKCS